MKIEKILNAVAKYYNISVDDLRFIKSRLRAIVTARSMAMYLLRKHGHTYQAIADIFGKDHATALHHYRRIEREMSVYQDINNDHERIIDLIRKEDRIYADALVGLVC
jgi:chromosomal replication initiation ATPase DnaA